MCVYKPERLECAIDFISNPFTKPFRINALHALVVKISSEIQGASGGGNEAG